MDSTTTSAADRRSAYRRVGAAAVLAFLALLLLGLNRGAAEADTTPPAAIPTVTPQRSAPTAPEPYLPRDRDGDGPHRGGGEPGFGGDGGTAPAPGTGGSGNTQS